MSSRILRIKSKITNKNVYYDNRLAKFTAPPVLDGDLYVDKNETIGGNLDISGNLKVGGDLEISRNLNVGGDLHVDNNQTIGGDVDVSGNVNVVGDVTATNFYSNGGNYYLDSYMLIPYGTIIQSAAINIPNGWLDCNGSSILKTVYLNLFNAIGYTYGGSGNNFNVPDIRGRVAVGAGTGVGLSARSIGNTGGEETHTLTTGEMPSHNHSINDPGHSHNWNNGLEGDDSGNGGSYSEYTTVPGSVAGAIASATTGITINSTGSGGAHNNMQPYIVFRYLIKY